MARGHRPGPRAGGSGDHSPSSSRERVLVLPGQEIPARGLRPGPGTYRVGGHVYASVLGLLAPRPPFVQVVPLSGRYIPKAGDTVIGTVTDAQNTFWLLDIGGPRWAPLHMTGTPWKVDIGETDKFLRVGDAVVVRVESLDPTGRIGVTMLGDDLGKLENGTIARLSPARVPRLVGRGGSMIQTIRERTGAEVAIGQNGRIWVGGPPEAIRRVSEVLRMIEENGQRSGLTDRVHRYLLASQPTSNDPGSADARRPGPGDDADDNEAAASPPPDESRSEEERTSWEA
jgi:exosome complex component RRP4